MIFSTDPQGGICMETGEGYCSPNGWEQSIFPQSFLNFFLNCVTILILINTNISSWSPRFKRYSVTLWRSYPDDIHDERRYEHVVELHVVVGEDVQQAALAAVLGQDAYVARVNTGADERVQIVVAYLSNLGKQIIFYSTNCTRTRNRNLL